MPDQTNSAMRECALELLERTEHALLEIFAGDVKTNAEEAWTLGGFRLALQWVLSLGGSSGAKDQTTPRSAGRDLMKGQDTDLQRR
jgi:hypothetical protein